MSDNKMPSYMAQLLEELGWDRGTRIPLTNPDNQKFETLLISRQNEIQQLKEAVTNQSHKCEDLKKYKEHVHTEYQENTRLLFAHKQQMEQEVKLKQLSCNEFERLERDVIDSNKQSRDINARVNRYQTTIGRLLKKADTLKSEVCGERGALQEWRAALERGAGDINAIERFTKQDVSKAKALETKRQNLKIEHDRMQDRLCQLVSNLSAEERACERISIQMIEGMEQRKQMMIMWTGAVENLRQRDTEIRHIREDYAVLEKASNNLAEQCREQQSFCDQQNGNNIEAQRENMVLAQQLSNIRLGYQELVDLNVTLDSEMQSLQRELSNMRTLLEKLHMENRQIMESQHKKDLALKHIIEKLHNLKEKLTDSLDKTKSSEKRAIQLEQMLNEEERYANQVAVNQQRAMHCSFVEQQKLLALTNEEKLFHMQLKASKAVMSKLDSKQKLIEKSLQSQKEALYAICYQLETLGARVMHMEGFQAEKECSAELLDKENRLKDVCARHAARVALLEHHAGKLQDDLRRTTKALEARSQEHIKLQSRLKTSMLNVAGGEKDALEARTAWRSARVEEALLRLRAAQAARALNGLGRAAGDLDARRARLEAAMNERLVEISARRDMFSVQKRALFEDCGKLKSEIKEREQRIEQLKKRYEIFIASLGKDDSGEQLSVTFFKIKFAAERAELREKGAALDADIGRREKDIGALEATRRVLQAAHAHFMRHISPLQDDSPEIQELNTLSKEYYEMRDELKSLNGEIAILEQEVCESNSRLTTLSDKYKQLTAREAESEMELESAREKVLRQDERLQNARDIVNYNAKRAKKLIDGVDDWRIFQMALWIRDYAESAYNALHALSDSLAQVPGAPQRLAALVASTDIRRYIATHERRLHMFINKILSYTTSSSRKESLFDDTTSVFSTSSESDRSRASVASGYTKRLTSFRRTLGVKLQEPTLVAEAPEQARRSTVSLRVITLGLDGSELPSASSVNSKKSTR